MNQACTLGVFQKKWAYPLKVFIDWTIIYFTGDLAPYGQTVGSMFWKIFFIGESSMHIGCIPKKLANPPKMFSDWTIIYFTGDLAPHGQSVGSLFWKDIFVGEFTMYIGCIPEKMGLST
jgi:hypothetical protein